MLEHRRMCLYTLWAVNADDNLYSLIRRWLTMKETYSYGGRSVKEVSKI